MDAQKTVYLNTAGVGLVSSESIQAAQKFQEGTLTNPMKTFQHWMQHDLPNLRKKTAQLIGTSPENVAFVPNFTYGLAAVLDSLRPQIKRVLLFEEDYPSLTMPMEMGDFETYYVKSIDHFSINLNRIIDMAEKHKVEAIVISNVQFLNGFTLDIATLGNFCKVHDIILIVDATQSLGAIDMNFDELNVDVMISSSYKWLNGGPGSAVLAFKTSFFQRFIPRFAGFGSIDKTSKTWSYTPSFASYEGGHLNPLGLLQLEKAIEQRLEMGVKKVEAHNKALIKRLREGLRNTSFKVRGGNDMQHLSIILTFEADEYIHGYLQEHGFAVTWRKGLIRVSPHFYNTTTDIDEFVQALIDWEKGDF